MKKKALRFSLLIIGSLALVFALFALTLYLNREKVKNALITELSEMLEADVDVQAVNISIQKFPYASIVFQNVYCPGANATENDTLIAAQQIFFEFHLWNVFSEDLKVSRVSFEKGKLQIIRKEDGYENYKIWKTDTTTSESHFTLEQVSFKDFYLYQYEEAAKQQLWTKVDYLTFTGDFESKQYTIKNSADVSVDSLLIGNEKILENCNISFSNEILGNDSTFKIQNGQLKSQKLSIPFELSIENETTNIVCPLFNVNLEEFHRLAQEQNWLQFDDIQFYGESQVNIEIKIAENTHTKIDVNFSTNKGASLKKGNIKLKLNSLEGNYSSKDGISNLNIPNFNAQGKTGDLKGKLSIYNLSRPKLSLELKSDLSLNEWLVIAPIDTLSSPTGEVELDIKFECRFRDIQNIKPQELRTAKASGKLLLENVSFGFKDSEKSVDQLRAELNLNGNTLNVDRLYCETGSSDIYLEGIIQNALNYLFIENEKIKIKTKLKSQQIVLEDFISSGSSNEEYSLDFAKTLNLDVDLSINKFLFKKFFATDISGNIRVDHGDIQARSISLTADEGTFNGNFALNNKADGHQLHSDLKARNVDIHELFQSCNNFGQSAIMAENLYGKASFEIQLQCAMNKGLEIDLQSIEMQSSLSIEDGNLKNYEPMLALSKYADIDELKDVRFSKLSNNIAIVNSTVLIPRMDISSNVLDMELEGKHQFNNNIDYRIRLNMSDVLFAKRKNKKKNSEFDEHLTEVENEDKPRLYIRMTGPALDPKIEIDSKAMAKSTGADIKKQGKELKGIFKKPKKETKKDNTGLKFDLFGEEDSIK